MNELLKKLGVFYFLCGIEVCKSEPSNPSVGSYFYRLEAVGKQSMLHVEIVTNFLLHY